MKRSTATGKNRKFVIIIYTAHVRFCKRSPIAEKEISAIKLLIGWQERANMLWS